MMRRAAREVYDWLLNTPAVFHAARYALIGDQKVTRALIQQRISASAGERVLDVCCGLGLFADAAAPATYIGVDLTSEYIRAAVRRHSGRAHCFFHVCDACGLPIADKSIEYGFIVNALHHFPDSLATNVLGELKRVVRKRVLVVDADANAPSSIQRLLVKMDRGKFMRTESQLVALISSVLAVTDVVRFQVGLYSECLVVCDLSERGTAIPTTKPRGQDRC